MGRNSHLPNDWLQHLVGWIFGSLLHALHRENCLALLGRNREVNDILFLYQMSSDFRFPTNFMYVIWLESILMRLVLCISNQIPINFSRINWFGTEIETKCRILINIYYGYSWDEIPNQNLKLVSLLIFYHKINSKCDSILMLGWIVFVMKFEILNGQGGTHNIKNLPEIKFRLAHQCYFGVNFIE